MSKCEQKSEAAVIYLEETNEQKKNLPEKVPGLSNAIYLKARGSGSNTKGKSLCFQETKGEKNVKRTMEGL